MQLLARFLDGTSRTCEPIAGWRPFSAAGYTLEWCVARAEEELVVLVRIYGDDGPIIGASVGSDGPSEADARHLLAAYGGRTNLLDSRARTPFRPVPRRPTASKPEYPFALVRRGFISEQEMTNFLSQQHRVPTIDLSEYVVALEIVALVSKDLCRTYRVLPVSRAGSSLIVAMVDPTNLDAIDGLKNATGMAIEPVIASELAIHAAISRYYGAKE